MLLTGEVRGLQFNTFTYWHLAKNLFNYTKCLNMTKPDYLVNINHIKGYALLSVSAQPDLPAASGHTQVPEYSSKWRPAVHLTSMASPSMQFMNTLQTEGSGCAKKPLRRGHRGDGLGGSVYMKIRIIMTKWQNYSSFIVYSKYSMNVYNVNCFIN